jgi:hypothetical protein
MFRFVLGAALSLWIGIAQTAFAAVPSGSIEDSTEGGFADKLKVGFFGWAYGNGLGKWDGRRAKHDGTDGDPVEVLNQISVMYPSNLGMDFVVMPQFKVRPLLTTPDKGPFEIVDPTIGLVGTVYKAGGFSWWARFDNALPLSAGSRKDGMILNPGAVNSIAYRFPSSSWELQAVIVPSFAVHDNGDLKSFLYTSPRVNYILDDSWTVFGIMETATETKRAAGLFNFTSASPTSLGGGFKYSFSSLYVQPFLNVYPFGRVDGASTYIGMFFGGDLM